MSRLGDHPLLALLLADTTAITRTIHVLDIVDGNECNSRTCSRVRTNEMTHENFVLVSTVSKINGAVRVDEAHPVVAPPIAERRVIVVPKDLVMCPVYLLLAADMDCSPHQDLSV